MKIETNFPNNIQGRVTERITFKSDSVCKNKQTGYNCHKRLNERQMQGLDREDIRSIVDLESTFERIGRTTLTFGPLEDVDETMQTEADRIESQRGLNGVK